MVYFDWSIVFRDDFLFVLSSIYYKFLLTVNSFRIFSTALLLSSRLPFSLMKMEVAALKCVLTCRAGISSEGFINDGKSFLPTLEFKSSDVLSDSF